MAKPIRNGKGKNSDKGKFNSALDRSWEVTWSGDETQFTNQAYDTDPPDPVTSDYATDSNDFFYLAAGQDWDYDGEGIIVPAIDGLGGSDQLILGEAATIADGFFVNIKNIEVLKLADGENDVTLGNFAAALDDAEATGIREVTGGAGDDTILFTDDYDGINVKVNGGEGDDVIETAGGDDTIIGGAGADTMTGGAGSNTFIWLAGDMAGTNTDHPDYDENDENPVLKFDVITDFKVYEEPVDPEDTPEPFDTLDISELLADIRLEHLDADYFLFTEEGNTTLFIDYDGNFDTIDDQEALVLLIGVTEHSSVEVIDSI